MYTKDEIKKQIIEAVNKVKAANPMAGSITNSVTINFVANAQLAVGGSAAMVYLPDEGEFIANAGGATYINPLRPSTRKPCPARPKPFSRQKSPGYWIL